MEINSETQRQREKLGREKMQSAATVGMQGRGRKRKLNNTYFYAEHPTVQYSLAPSVPF